MEPLDDDPTMRALLERYGRPEPLVPAESPYRELCVAVINQGVSTASGRAVRERVVDTLGGAVTPDGLLAADDAALRAAGLSGRKADTLRAAARAFRAADYSAAGLADRDDDAVIDLLTRIDGVGPWTARIYLLFGLGREDVLPLGDLAVRRSLETLYGAAERAEMRAVAEAWRPRRSYGTLLLWKQYEDDPAAPLAR